MNLLKAIAIYMALLFTSSVSTTAGTDLFETYTAPTPTPYVTVAPTAEPEQTPVPTINITPNPAYKTLNMGDSGDAVVKLQEKLTEYGYFSGDIDGRYGNQTRRAVEKFQRAHGLSADGIAGRITQTVLYESNEVRIYQETPAVTEVPELVLATVAASDEATPASAATPAPEENATAAPTFTPTPVPTTTPTPTFEAMDGYAVYLGDSETPVADTDGSAVKAYHYGETVYLPLFRLLSESGSNVLTDSTTDGDSYAFVVGKDIVSISLSVNHNQNVENFRAFCNGIEMVIQDRELRLVDEELYFPVATIVTVTKADIQIDEASKVIRITFQEAER